MKSSPMYRRFRTLLIANRGEIACRVIRTARAMGLRTVAVYLRLMVRSAHSRRSLRTLGCDARVSNHGGPWPPSSFETGARTLCAFISALHAPSSG